MAQVRKCATCLHCAVIDGQCRANPPQAFMIPTSQGPVTVGAWPPVQPLQWCGRYERADDEEIGGRTAAATELVGGPRLVKPEEN
jgi:hypothetical protein